MILGLWALGFYVTQSYDCPAPDVCLRMTGLGSARVREGFRARALMTSLATREPSSCLFEACGMIDVLYDLLGRSTEAHKPALDCSALSSVNGSSVHGVLSCYDP